MSAVQLKAVIRVPFWCGKEQIIVDSGIVTRPRLWPSGTVVSILSVSGDLHRIELPDGMVCTVGKFRLEGVHMPDVQKVP